MPDQPTGESDLNASQIRKLTTKVAALATATGTVTLDFDVVHGTVLQQAALTGDVTFATANGKNGKSTEVFMDGGSGVNLAFPAGWRFVGAKPTAIAAGKKAVLKTRFVGGDTDAFVIASYAVEA